MAAQFGHERLGLVSPTRDAGVRVWLRAMQRGVVPPKDPKADIGAARIVRKKPASVLPLTYRLLEQILDVLPKSSVERRNHALLLIGWHTGLSRTALVAMNLGDVRFGTDMLVLTVRADGFLDEDGSASAKPRRLTIPLTNGPMCCGAALRLYIGRAALDIEDPTGPLWRRCDRAGQVTVDRLRPAAVATVVKQAVASLGLESPGRYSSHSLVLGHRQSLARGAR